MNANNSELDLLKEQTPTLLIRSDYKEALQNCIENAFSLHEQVDNKIIDGTKTITHSYFLLPNHLKTDCDYENLAIKMFDALVDYVIPRSKVEEANGLAAKISRLQRDARHKFIDYWTCKKKMLANKEISPEDFRRSGEGGEVLLFLLAEQILKLPQAICKMSLKTSPQMPIHGSDGIHIGLTEDGKKLALYYGEAKVYADLSDAIRECVESIAPHLLRETDDTDLFLLNTFCDFGNNENARILKEGLKNYFDKEHRNNKLYTDVRGICLVAFNDNSSYTFEDMTETAKNVSIASEQWIEAFFKKLKKHNLENIVINVFFVPMTSVDIFRETFAKIVKGDL